LSPALLRPNQQPPHYPAEAEGARVAGYVELQFVVDTDGRAETNSIHDVREMGRQHMTPDAFQYYDAFVREMRKALLRWRFAPARVEACPVTQSVVLPVKFSAPGRM
jgi:outer membrane biosynthesis protein TonB